MSIDKVFFFPKKNKKKTNKLKSKVLKNNAMNGKNLRII